MSRILVVFMTLSMSMSAFADLPKTWKEIVDNPKYIKSPTVDQTFVRAVKPTGDYQLFKVADRFVFLFDGEGRPVVAFDTTMEPLKLTDMILGSIGIGQWSIKSFWNKYKKAKENPEGMLKQENPVEGVNASETADEFYENESLFGEISQVEDDVLGNSEKDIKRGYKEFAKLKFTDEWIKKNGGTAGVQRLAKGKRDGFKPATFTMADLYLEPKHEAAVQKVMNEFSVLVYQNQLQRSHLSNFMTQFAYEWVEAEKAFKMIWQPSKVSGPKPKPIPGWVLNFANPLDILSYKYSLYNLDRNTIILESIIPSKYADLIAILVSRVTNGLRYRMDHHENQLQALIEAQLRGEYEVGIPWEDPDQAYRQILVMLCLNKITKNEDVTNGEAKCAEISENETKYRKENLSWLDKKKYTYELWPDNRFATVYKNGKRKGVFNVAMKRAFITRHPAVHYYDNAPWYKTFNRVGLEVFVDAVRMVMPSQFYLGQNFFGWLNIGIGIYIPSAVWDILFRGRSFTEIGYEGLMTGMLNENVNGRFKAVPGYTQEEAAKIRNALYNQRANTFEIPLKYEQNAIVANYKLIMEFLGGGRIQSLNMPIP